MKKNNKVVVGADLGDAGKGKFCDFLAQKCKVVVRSGGANNCGHTIRLNGKKTVLHLIPCGILHKNVVNVIANGVLVDPLALWQEISDLVADDVFVSPNNLKISGGCFIITEIERAIDRYDENKKGDAKIGSTLRGVAPGMERKVGRRGAKLISLLDENKLKKVFNEEEYNLLNEKYSINKTYEVFINELLDVGQKLKPYLTDTALYLSEKVKEGDVLFAGAQGVLLDVDHGSYPYVSSGSCLAASAAVGSGIGAQYLHEIIGVSKAYITRVGAGAFPTKMDEEMDNYTRKVGAEYGASTGRPRLCGWLSLVDLRYAARINGLTCLAMSKFDVFSGLNQIKLCVSYTIDGIEYKEMPLDHADLFRATPNYITLPCWSGDITGIRDKAALPKEMLDLIAIIEKEIKIPVKYISVGAERNEIIEVDEEV